MRFSRSPRLEVIDLGRCEYLEADFLMRRRLEARIRGEVDDVLILGEFEPVVTVGRGARVENYASLNIPVHEVARGGKATYHGPGQLVVYPVISLEGGARDLHAYLRALEAALIASVGEFGLEAAQDPRNTGCWIGGRKVASIGIAVRRWVSWHGLALNITTDLEAFREFDPCGLEPELMTTLAEELGEPPDREAVRDALVDHLRRQLR